MSTGWTAPGTTGTAAPSGAEQVADDGAGIAPPAGPGPTPGPGEPPRGPRRELVQSLPLFPLRPLGLGEVLGAAVRIYRLRARSVLSVSAIVYGIAFVLLTLSTGAGMVPMVGDIRAAMEDPTAESSAFTTVGDGVLTAVSWVVTMVVSILSAALVTVALTKVSIGEATGETVSTDQMWATMRRRGLPAIGVSLVISVAGTLAFVLAAGLGTLPLLIVQEASALTIIPIVVGVGLGVLAILYVWARTILAVPVLVIEEVGVVASLRRSLALSRGGRLWRLFGSAVLLYVLYMFAVQIVSGVLGTVAFVLYLAILLATGGQALVLGMVVMTVLIMAGGYLATFLLAPFLSAGYVALYADARMRHEAWDVELTRRARESWAPEGAP
ncbi:glycerophosphoryl diester phosphodiesterase membrane domain-containing protein [Brachybacterium sp. YJGR34]|uniref:glycerophosphoryl diester phosphodiesterase membrane domain-containing protein n=1 Tax=Brachybacterium sp. YJGR34 TaxID=2059911 RepID=UPI000E0B3A31|nr:glycerophosphoryl diester phosphodiesterase membrane domain-containing protein [Brachybacterium sp. YJGR34]